MEELKKSMQALFKKTTNDNDSDKYLHFCPRFKPPVKIANWYLPQEALPKDNDPYDPPGGHYFLSTYKRLGTSSEDGHWDTTTGTMLRQICDVESADATVYKPMVNFATNRLLEENKEDYEGLEAEDIDFVTTYNYDFRYPFPYAKRYSQNTKTEEKNQKFGMGKTQFNSSPELCDTKFMDDYLLLAKCSPGKP